MQSSTGVLSCAGWRDGGESGKPSTTLQSRQVGDLIPSHRKDGDRRLSGGPEPPGDPAEQPRRPRQASAVTAPNPRHAKGRAKQLRPPGRGDDRLFATSQEFAEKHPGSQREACKGRRKAGLHPKTSAFRAPTVRTAGKAGVHAKRRGARRVVQQPLRRLQLAERLGQPRPSGAGRRPSGRPPSNRPPSSQSGPGPRGDAAGRP